MIYLKIYFVDDMNFLIYENIYHKIRYFTFYMNIGI